MKRILATIALTGMSWAVLAAPLADLKEGQTGRIEFQSMSASDQWSYVRKNPKSRDPVTVWGDLLMPKTVTGKVPALLLSHGSGGVSPYAYEVWAAKMNAAGVAVFNIDSFKPRGFSETNTTANPAGPMAQVADALSGLRMLSTHPQIDANRIYNVGMSRGGSTAFDTAWPLYQNPVDTNGVKFAGHIPVYPGNCDMRYRADASGKSSPMFVALAEVDKEDWGNGANCIRYYKELAAAGHPITFKEYKGAHHGFDGRSKFFHLNNAYVSSKCDMEVQLTPVLGGGLGRDVKDFKTGKTLTSYDEWNNAGKACLSQVRARVEGNEKLSDELIKDVLKFMGVTN